MESSVMVTGIGGQGVQLLAKTLALGATEQGRHAMLSSEVGGEMRGGPSLASVVIGDVPVRALPILESTDAVILAHRKFGERAMARLRDGGLCLVNTSVVAHDQVPEGPRVVPLAAAELAKECGAPQSVGFVLLGAFAGATGVVDRHFLLEAMRRSLPPYRQHHAAANAEAIECGFAAVYGSVVEVSAR